MMTQSLQFSRYIRKYLHVFTTILNILLKFKILLYILRKVRLLRSNNYIGQIFKNLFVIPKFRRLRPF